MRKRARLIGIVVSLASVSLLQASASAHTIVVNEDRSENVVTFTYDSEDGSVPSETSRGRRRTDENVTFTVAIAESQDAGAGLIGRVKLQLNGDHRTTYSGWFTFKVVDDSGDVVFQKSRPANIRLHPRPGMRRASVPFRFDLPSGTYRATGSFASE